MIVVGVRTDGRPLGAYVMTRNASNPTLAPGAYTQVVDSLETGSPIPRKIFVHDGHNGGPKMVFPSGAVVMDVS